MGLYSYPRKRKTGARVNANKTEVKYIDQEFSTVIPGTYNVGTIVSSPSTHYFNRWFSMSPTAAGNPFYPYSFFNYYNTSYGFANAGEAFQAYTASAFSLVIPQGVDAHSRIGNVVQVLKDKWYIRIRPVVANGTFSDPDWTFDVSRYLSERPFRVRAVAVFTDRIDIPGQQWLKAQDIFEFPDKLESRLDPGAGKGFTVVYDKTATFQGIRPEASAVEAYAANGVEVQNSTNSYCQFGFSTKYVRQYADRNEDATDVAVTASGNEADPSAPAGTVAGFVNDRGISRGLVQWFFFIEDIYASVYTGADAEGDINNRRYYPSAGMEMFVLRKTSFADD